MRRVHTLSVLIAVLALLTLGAGGVAADAPDVSIATDASDGSVATDASTVPNPTAIVPQATTPAECDADADTEVVGCWNGTRYDDDLEFNQSDGLTEAELENLTHLSMARVEHLRERPFREGVPVQTVTRSEFENDTPTGGNGTSDEAFQRWNDQVWKALFVVGEDESAGDEIDTVFGGAVTGFYSPSEDRIVLVVAEGEALQVSESTLAHELVHAMQDQYHDLTAPRYVGATQDGDLAIDGAVEGEAVHVEELYDARCAGNWSCLEEPDSSVGGGSGSEFNFGILQTVLQPYSDGALYVEALVDEEGWAAVNETMARPPETTSEVIHRTPDYQTREVEFTDTATGGWETYPDQGVDGAETAGEASMFVMFWYQSLEYDYPVLEPTASAGENVQIHLDAEQELRTRSNYNYAHEATEGWAGDELYPYRADGGDDGDARDGYVWVTEWQTTEDATEFHETYLEMLTAHGDAPYDEGQVYTIDDGDFRGAYGVDREGTTVTITHAPEPNGVLELRPDADFELPSENGDEDGATDGNGTDSDDGTDPNASDDGDSDGDMTDDGDGSSTPDATSSGEAPGFGVVAALVGLIAALSLLVRRSRP